MKSIGYVRVSTEEQARSGLGLDAQRAAVESEAARRGWTLDLAVDDGYSAKDLRRPAITAALAQLRAGDAQVLVVAKLDRLSRSLVDFAALLEAARREGWAMVALDLGVDMTTPADEMVASVMAAVAQWSRMIGAGPRRPAGEEGWRRSPRLARNNPQPGCSGPHRAARAVGQGPTDIARALDADGIPIARRGARPAPRPSAPSSAPPTSTPPRPPARGSRTSPRSTWTAPRPGSAPRPGLSTPPASATPTRSGGTASATTADARVYDRARAICDRCPVKVTCLVDAIAHGDRHGMWGGATPEGTATPRAPRPPAERRHRSPREADRMSDLKTLLDAIVVDIETPAPCRRTTAGCTPSRSPSPPTGRPASPCTSTTRTTSRTPPTSSSGPTASASARSSARADSLGVGQQ
jgi:hypothetical protein